MIPSRSTPHAGGCCSSSRSTAMPGWHGPVRTAMRCTRWSSCRGLPRLASTGDAASGAAFIATIAPEEIKDSGSWGLIPGPLKERKRIWSEEVWSHVPDVKRRIFCNRSLNMKQIKAIGWDMDYTLAQYRPDTFEALAHRQTMAKLVDAFGYPSLIQGFTFDHRYMSRGVILDKKRGNVIKVDRHKYVKLAYHGFRRLSSEERDKLYNSTGVRDSFEEPEYGMVDTLFSLAEAYLFCQLVELADKKPAVLPNFSGYANLYRDVRAAVDLCHRDGSLKREVAAHPEQYIHADPHLVPMLNMYKAAGKTLFLATNSLWDYTHVVMNFLVQQKVGRQKTDDWLRFFDVVLVGCAKPGFFSERRPLFAVDPATGALRNTDGGAPIIPIGEEDLPAEGVGSSARQVHVGADEAALVFQGGNYVDLHKMLGIRAGSEVLYVGDHIYGDILRSKKSLGWRTMLVVPELESELDVAQQTRETQTELSLLRAARADLDDQIQRLQWAFRNGEVPGGSAAQNTQMLGDLQRNREALKAQHKALLKAHHERFHPVWGRLLKTGYQNSRYAHQIDRFACLYTSHVSSMAFYSPEKSYGGRVDFLAHEDLLSSLPAPSSAAAAAAGDGVGPHAAAAAGPAAGEAGVGGGHNGSSSSSALGGNGSSASAA